MRLSLSVYAPVFLLVASALSVTLGTVDAFTRFEVRNACGYTVWPGLLTGSGGNPAAMEGGRSPTGFMLRPQESATLEVPHDWSGRLWGRAGCSFTSDGVGTCQSGDCSGRLSCAAGVGATPPVSLVEFSAQGIRSTKDFYDVSLVDGFNLPISITPGALPSTTTANRTSCAVAGCAADLNDNCPSQLQVIVDNKVVACKSACLALKSDQYCCSGAFSNANTCKPSSYSRIFKAACPNAYTYAYDDPTSLYTCAASNYTITFCPSSSKLASSAGQKKDPSRPWAYLGAASLFLIYFEHLALFV